MSRYDSLRRNADKILEATSTLLKKTKDKVVDPKNQPPSKPTLPLPVNDTGTKEGLVIYFSTQKVVDIDAAIAKVLEKSDIQLKFDTSIIENNKNKYDGNPTAADKTKSAIDFLNTQIITDPGTKKMLLNSLSSGRYISENIGGGNGVKVQDIDRGDETFGKIKEHAMKLIKDVGVKLSAGESDKWCPADFFIYGSGVSISNVQKTTTLNIDKNSINSLFIDSFKSPGSGKILGVSLKEEKAQAGKATSFLTVLTRSDNYPEVKPDEIQSKFTALAYLFKAIRAQKDLGYVSEAISVIQKNRDGMGKVVGSSEVKKLETALTKQLIKSLIPTTGKNKGVSLTMKQLAILQNKNGIFDKGLTRSYISQSKLEKEFELTPGLQTAITAFNNELVQYALKRYKTSKSAFKKILKASNFNEPTEKKTLDTQNSELLLKKAGCYDVASKVLNGVSDGKKLDIPPAFKNIVLEKQNVFLAVTAYAISQGGISPTFFKLIGSETGGTAHVKTFYSDGTLSLEKGTDVEIIDSGEFAGFEVEFKSQILKGTELIDKYKVTLGFQYAGDQFKIEVTELK